MSGFLGARNTMPNKLGSIQVQTSEYGVALPVGFGRFRASLKLLDYIDFVAKKVSQGGKGGGATGYEYYAAVMLTPGKGPIGGIGNIYDESGSMNLVEATETYTIPSGGGTYTVHNAGSAFYYDEGVTYEGTYSTSADDYGSDGLTTITGFDTLPMESVAGSPGALQYHQNNIGGYTFSAADAGKVVSISYAYTQQATHEPSTSSPAQFLALTVLNGTRPQYPWGYMSSRHPERALSYAGTVIIADSSMDLGSSATVPSYNMEILNGQLLAFGAGISDCDPAAIINAILTDPYVGMLWNYLGDLTLYSNYCVANGFFLSPLYETAAPCMQAIKDLLDLTNSEGFWSPDGGGQLKVVPYGDTTVVGFGRTYTPQTQPLYDLTDDDFQVEGDEEPVTMELPDLADNYNYFKMEFKNRAQSYKLETIDDVNMASLNLIGLRPANVITAHSVTEAEVAQLILNALTKRGSYAFGNYKFKLNWCFQHLEQMDIVTITSKSGIGYNRFPVRVKRIEEDEKGILSFECEDFPWGVGQPAIFPRQTGGGGGATGRNFPGSVYTPIIFEANDRISRSGAAEIWIGLIGQNPDWGGCNIWLSTDGTNYAPIGTQQGCCRMGYLATTVGAGSDPDVSDEFDVVLLNGPNGSNALISSTEAAADAFQTISYLDNELIAFSHITLKTVSGVAVNALDTYTRRAVFGTAAVGHAVNAPFLRLDSSVFSYVFDPTLIGKNVWFKFTSFNTANQMEQALSDATAYEFTVTGKFGNSTKSLLSNMTLDSAVQSGGVYAQIEIYNGTLGTAGSFYRQDGTTFTAPAATLTGFAFSTTYYVSFNPNTQAYVVYTDIVAYQDGISLGFIGLGALATLASSGTGGTSGGAPTGTGGGGSHPPVMCPTEEMFVLTSLQLADAQVGDELDCIEPATGKQYKAAIQTLSRALRPCVEITAGGAQLEVSVETPFELQDGSTKWASDMDGELVLVDDGEGTPAYWVPCHVKPIGERWVMAVNLGGRTFAAGSLPHKRIYSHNMAKLMTDL